MYATNLDKFFVRVEKEWADEIDYAVLSNIFNRLNIFDRDVEKLEFCSLYESDFSEDEISFFESELENDFSEPSLPIGEGTRVRFRRTKRGDVIVETTDVDKFSGTVTNFWRRSN